MVKIAKTLKEDADIGNTSETSTGSKTHKHKRLETYIENIIPFKARVGNLEIQTE